MREGSATPQARATPEHSMRAVPATHKASVLAERWGHLFMVALALAAAFAIDWLVVPRSYPVSAAYGVSLILAALLLASPVIVAAVGVLALALRRRKRITSGFVLFRSSVVLA
jgi:multisubunit Na+/H+ antiporter MnhE subunit